MILEGKLKFLLILFFVPFLAYSQLITIKDKETNQPLGHVTLLSEEPKVVEITDEYGIVDITSFAGSKQIKIQMLGYLDEEKTYEELSLSSSILLLRPSDINMEEVVVSAMGWQQKASDIAFKIHTISAKDAALLQPQTAADLLGISGKVFIQKSQQGGGSPMIRGFAANRLLYSVDGVRMNIAIFRSGNIHNVISLDPFALENTEVIFGPGAVIYGSDAIGGVMAFKTLVPELAVSKRKSISGKATIRYATANREKSGHAAINIGLKKFASVSSFSYNYFDDLRMGTHGPEEYLRHFFVRRVNNHDVIIENDDQQLQVPSGFSRFNIMQKIMIKPSKSWTINYGFHYSETSNIPRYDRHIQIRNNLPRYGEWLYGPQKWLMNNLNVSHTGNNKFYSQASLILAQQYFKESRISRGFNTPVREIRLEKVPAFSINLDLKKPLNNNNELFYGFEIVHNKINSTGLNKNLDTGSRIPGPSRYPLSTWASYAVYLSGQSKVSEKLSIIGGLRYNNFALKAVFDTSYYSFPFTATALNNGSLTGSLGLNYKPKPQLVFTTNLSTGFRFPNIDDIGKVFDSEPGFVVVPNPDLKGEYAFNVDIGIKKKFKNRIQLEVSGYYTFLQNALVRRNFTLNGFEKIVYDGVVSQVQAVQNAAYAMVYGTQAGIEIEVYKGLSFSSDFNYQVGKEELDNGETNPLRHTAPFFGTTRLNFESSRLTVQFYLIYSGKKTYDSLPLEERSKTELYARDSDGNPYSPGWFTLNFKSMFNFNKYISINAGLENITDRRYLPYSSGIVSPGINGILSLMYTFNMNFNLESMVSISVFY